MCIIVAKKAGLDLPNKELLRACELYNSDGAGLMYVNHDKKVVIEKGFMKFEDFYKRLEELDNEYNLKNKALVMHFRITTQGGTNPYNCHPFPISNKKSDLKATYIECDQVGMAHNGTIKLCSNSSEKDMSDTQLFIRDYLYHIYKNNKTFYQDEAIRNMIKNIGGSKFCFLDKNEKIFIIGDWIEESTGVLYSNESYLYSSYSSYIYGYEDDSINSYLNEPTHYSINESSYNQELDLFDAELETNYIRLDEKHLILSPNGELLDLGSEEFVVDAEGTLYVVDYDYLEVYPYKSNITIIDKYTGEEIDLGVLN